MWKCTGVTVCGPSQSVACFQNAVSFSLSSSLLSCQFVYMYSWGARSKIWKSTGSEGYRRFDDSFVCKNT